MKCVKSVSYSVLINGQPFGNISPTRGLRQGDPLSPCLFLIVVKGLRSLLSKAKFEGKISRVPIAAGDYRLSHLLFAYDSLLFCRDTGVELKNLSQVLQSYERASSQQLNVAKTSIFFSRNCREEFRRFPT
jgi:hypothetical protein